jgi:hypothetical protein
MNEKFQEKVYELPAPGHGANAQPRAGLRLTKLPSGHCLTSAVHAMPSSGIGGGGGA